MKRLNSILVLYLIISSFGFLYGQQLEISGTVSDETETLIGATVIVKGTSLGTTTDFEGKYYINAEVGDTLSFSYVGLASQDKVVQSGQSIIDVILNTDLVLDEIVVVGYTEKGKKKLTSAVSTLGSEDISNAPVSTFDNVLQGAAAGLNVQSGSGQPGDAAKLTLRGLKSFALSTEPLYILDGQQINADIFVSINPNDIESVSVLKDAAATQIYGSRGSNGVIVITTKSGQYGKARIQYNSYYGYSPKPTYNKGLEPLSSGQLIDLSQEIGIGGIINVGASEEKIAELRSYSEDWLDVVTRNGRTMNQELSLSGGTDYTNYYISGGYFKQEGIALRSGVDRYSLRSKIEHGNETYRVGANLYLSYSDIQDSESEGDYSRNNPFYSSIRTPAYDRAIDPVTGGYAAPLDPTQSSVLNNLERIETNDEDRDRGFASIGLTGLYNFKFLEGLDYRINLNAIQSTKNYRTYLEPNSVAGKREPGGQGSLYQLFGNRFRYTITNSLGYKFRVQDLHEFNVRLYQEFLSDKTAESHLEGYGLNQVTTIAGITQGSPTNGFIPVIGGFTDKSTLASLFTSIDYSYLSKYNVSFGLRRDGSSRFGANYRFGTFYSIGVGWTVSEENFFRKSDAVSYLKLRMSYGNVGNDNVSSTAAIPAYASASYNGINGIYEGLANPDLKWEETAKANLGIDLSLLKDRLIFNIDLYSERTKDLFQNVPISQTSGFTSQLRNVGSLKNEGIELAITGVIMERRNFQWEATFNTAYNKTTILKLNNGESFYNGDFLIEEGSEYPVFNLVKRAGVNPVNGRTLWYDLDGNLTENYDLKNRVNVGRATPRYTGGLHNTFTYKGFQLRALFSFSEGSVIFNTARSSLDNPTKISRGSVSTNALRFWRVPGDFTDIPDPRQISNYFDDSGWLENNSFLRLRNLALSYSIPSNQISRYSLSGLRFFVQGQNLITWSTFTGLDPENSDYYYVQDYPSLTTYTFGLQVNL